MPNLSKVLVSSCCFLFFVSTFCLSYGEEPLLVKQDSLISSPEITSPIVPQSPLNRTGKPVEVPEGASSNTAEALKPEDLLHITLLGATAKQHYFQIDKSKLLNSNDDYMQSLHFLLFRTLSEGGFIPNGRDKIKYTLVYKGKNDALTIKRGKFSPEDSIVFGHKGLLKPQAAALNPKDNWRYLDKLVAVHIFFPGMTQSGGSAFVKDALGLSRDLAGLSTFGAAVGLTRR